MSNHRLGLLVVSMVGVSVADQTAGFACQRPRLLFGSSDVPTLRDRVKGEPYRSVYQDFKTMLDEHRSQA